jgi:hypothetical protein
MARLKMVSGEKPLFGVGSSKEDLLAFPEAVKEEMGTALSCGAAAASNWFPYTRPLQSTALEVVGVFGVALSLVVGMLGISTQGATASWESLAGGDH